MTDRKAALLLIFCGLAVLIISLVYSTAKEQGTPLTNLARALPFRVVAAERYQHPDLLRVGWHIVAPEAILKEDRAATISNAAQILFNQTKADLVVIWLQPDQRVIGSGLVLAKIEAVPERNDFKIMVSDTVFTDREIEIEATLKLLRGQYMRGSELDETGLYREVRNRFALPDSYVFPMPPYQQPMTLATFKVIGGKDPTSVENPPSFYRK